MCGGEGRGVAGEGEVGGRSEHEEDRGNSTDNSLASHPGHGCASNFNFLRTLVESRSGRIEPEARVSDMAAITTKSC